MYDNSTNKEVKKEDNFIKIKKDLMEQELDFMHEMMNNKVIINMAKNPNFLRFVSDMQNDPTLKGLINPPEVTKKFMDKDNNIDVEGLMKYNMENYKAMLNDPNMVQNPYENFNKLLGPQLKQLEKDELSEDIKIKEEKSDVEN